MRQPSHRGSLRGATARITTAGALVGALAATGALPATAGPATTANPATSTMSIGMATDKSPPLLARHVAAPRQSIPDAAMLQPEDLTGITPVADDDWAALRPPQPCASGRYPSAALLRADRAISAMIGVDDRPTVVVEHVATYRSDGAHRYLRELRRALIACGGLDQDGARWTVRATGVAGDESLLLRIREYVDYAESYKNTYLVVARVGRALVVVADTGWETASGHEALVRELSVPAVRRAAILR